MIETKVNLEKNDIFSQDKNNDDPNLIPEFSDSETMTRLLQVSHLTALTPPPSVRNASKLLTKKQGMHFFEEIEFLIDIINKGRDGKLQDAQEILLYVNIENRLTREIQQVIDHISITPLKFQNFPKKTRYIDIHVKTKDLLTSITNYFPRTCKRLLQDSSAHALLVNYITLKDLSTFTTAQLREFLKNLFFKSTMTRGGKNRYGSFPPRITIPIEVNDQVHLLRSADAIKPESIPSATVFTRQVMGDKVLNYQDYVDHYLTMVLRILQGEMKHGRMKPLDFASLLGIRRDPKTKKIGLPHNVKFLRMKWTVGDLVIFDGFLTQSNFIEVMKSIYCLTELLLTHPSILKEFDPQIQHFLLTRKTRGGKTFGMAAKWLNYQKRIFEKLDVVEKKLMDFCILILNEISQHGTTILGSTFYHLMGKKHLTRQQHNKTDIDYSENDQTTVVSMLKMRLNVKKQKILDQIIRNAFDHLLQSGKSSETKRDLAHSYVAGLLGLSKSELTRRLGHRAVMITNDDILMTHEAKKLIHDNADAIMNRLMNAFNEVILFLKNGTYVVTIIENVTNYLQMRKVVRERIKDYLVGNTSSFHTISLQRNFIDSLDVLVTERTSKIVESNTVLEIFRAVTIILASETPHKTFSLENGSEGTYTYLFRAFISKMAYVSDVDLPPRITAIIKHQPIEVLTSGHKGSATFDEEIILEEESIVHEIKQFKVRTEKNKLKIIMGKSDPSQKTQRESVGKVIFSFMSIVRLEQGQPQFIHAFVT